MKLFKRKKAIADYYDISDIDKTGATYRLIVGQRSNGKTYACIHKVIERWCKDGTPSAYIRRFSEEIRPKFLNTLLAPHIEFLEKASKGKFNDLKYVSGCFYPCYRNPETGKVETTIFTPLLYCVALNTWETSKGADRGELAYIIFDEFMTRRLYLENEFVSFANCLSSLIRTRDGVVVYMLANTVNKYNPYAEEMGLFHMEKQEKGSIEVYTYNNDRLTVAVEYCMPSSKTLDVEHYFAFDNPALDMITTGDWETDSYRHIQEIDFVKSPETNRGEFLVEFNNAKVIGEIHTDGAKWIVFFHDFGKSNKEFTDRDVIYTDKPITSLYHSNNIFEGNTSLSKCLSMLLRQGHDYYSNNAVGEIINNFIKYSRR